jgi:urocanate hydratase
MDVRGGSDVLAVETGGGCDLGFSSAADPKRARDGDADVRVRRAICPDCHGSRGSPQQLGAD